MMSLNLIRLDPDPALSVRWLAAESLLPHSGDDGGYGWHALLTAAFGRERAPKPYCVRTRRGREPQILAYTNTDAGTLQQAAESFADPAVFCALRLGENPVAGKPMPAFSAGRRLGFTLRVRPTVRTDRDGDRRRSAEIDAYVAALRSTRGAAVDRKAVYSDWTRQKLEAGGVRVHALRFDGLNQVKTMRRDADRRQVPVNGHSAELTGVLEVTDPGAFRALLARGVGRHRAFGYGMLLLLPA